MRRRLLPLLLLPFGCLPAAWAGDIFSLQLTDSEGRLHNLAEARKSKAAVFLFLGTDCPLSNRYSPDLSRLFAEYSGRGVKFYAVHSDPFISAGQVRKHAREFGYPFPALLDWTQALARGTGATVTPEAAVISPGGKVLYRGRIDDRLVDFGKERQHPGRHDLRIALDEILAGKPVSKPFTKALGCDIPLTRGSSPEPGPTFTRDIAPILYRNCVGCHRPGQVAPFSLLSYQDAAKRAGLIASVTQSRYMPLWKPQPGYGKFQGERRLTEAEISRLGEWAGDGAPEGDPADLPPAPKFPEGWQLGKPDLVAGLPQPFAVPASGPDIYQCFVIPLDLPQDRYVKAVEFRPGNPRLVHHALFFADLSGEARRRAGAGAGPGYPCFGVPGFVPSGSLGGWSPGGGPIQFPDGAAAVLKKGSDLVMQIHFHPAGKSEQEQSTLALYFTGSPPKKKLVDVALGSHNIDIPPGRKDYKIRDHFTLPVDVEAIGIIPHAHFICRDMKGVAVLPDGTRKGLLWIRDWDFNWQEQYRYETPVHLPADTLLEMEFTYDNSAGNPRNPNRPPQRVMWGPGITDEMAGLHIEVIPDRMEELPVLGQALWGKIMRSVGGKFFQLPR
jgi:thiol-disulfide isomerase/thioredoxin